MPSGDQSRFDRAFLAEFDVISELSSGGMGVVYLARQKSLDRQVAVKFPLLGDRELLERFEAEAKMLAGLDHGNIVQVYAWGRSAGHPYLVEELVEGTSLRQLLDRRGVLKQVEALEIARDIADALAYLHGLGMVHRDLKPSNVLIAGGEAKLIDFGIARELDKERRTQAGVILGTPEYIAPEVFTGEESGPAADVYALGIILYEMLTGAQPHTGPDLSSMLRQRTTRDAPQISGRVPTVSARMDALIGRMLARDAASRPDVARTVVPELEAELAEFTGTPREATRAMAPSVRAPAAEQTRSVSAVRRGAGMATVAFPSSSGLRSAAAPKAAQPGSRWPLLLVPVAAVGVWLAIPRAASPPPPAPVVVQAPVQPPAPSLEPLAREVEEAKPEARAAAYYKLMVASPETSIEPRRLARLRELALAAGAPGLVRAMESGPRAARRLAAADAVALCPAQLVEALIARLLPLDLRQRAVSLGVNHGDETPKSVQALRGAATDLAASVAGTLWDSVEDAIPQLALSEKVPLDLRRALVSEVLMTKGFSLLYARARLPVPLDADRALRGVVSWTALPVSGFKKREPWPLPALLASAGLSGVATDVLVNEWGKDGYVHKDALGWYMAAVGDGHNMPDLKESDTIERVRLPPGGTRPAELVFVGCARDLDSEDAIVLGISPAEDPKATALRLILVRPDAADDAMGDMILTTRVQAKLLPPGDYTVRVTVRRLLTNRRFLQTQRRMRSALLRLSVVAPGKGS